MTLDLERNRLLLHITRLHSSLVQIITSYVPFNTLVIILKNGRVLLCDLFTEFSTKNNWYSTKLCLPPNKDEIVRATFLPQACQWIFWCKSNLNTMKIQILATDKSQNNCWDFLSGFSNSLIFPLSTMSRLKWNTLLKTCYNFEVIHDPSEKNERRFVQCSFETNFVTGSITLHDFSHEKKNYGGWCIGNKILESTTTNMEPKKDENKIFESTTTNMEPKKDEFYFFLPPFLIPKHKNNQSSRFIPIVISKKETNQIQSLGVEYFLCVFWTEGKIYQMMSFGEKFKNTTISLTWVQKRIPLSVCLKYLSILYFSHEAQQLYFITSQPHIWQLYSLDVIKDSWTILPPIKPFEFTEKPQNKRKIVGNGKIDVKDIVSFVHLQSTA